MIRYRFQFLNDKGRLVSSESHNAADDLDALEFAEDRCNDFTVEIWDGERRVGRVKKGDAPLATEDRQSL